MLLQHVRLQQFPKLLHFLRSLHTLGMPLKDALDIVEALQTFILGDAVSLSHLLVFVLESSSQ